MCSLRYRKRQLLCTISRLTFQWMADLGIRHLRVLSVKPFVASKVKQGGRRLRLWLVTFGAPFTIDHFTPAKAINRTLVRFERIMNKQILQCKNCQWCDHAAINYHLQYRCVKYYGSYEQVSTSKRWWRKRP